MRIPITIQRFNPESDVKPHFVDYTIEAGRETTVLLALIQIKEEIDGSLSFRASCRAAICGSDLMMINGIQ
ncbi:MAG: 2Fe-2S iron-sulfur cluster-binding protein, partial [Nitrospiria bacterium]